MHEHGSLPRARQDDLLEETAGEELLLSDQDSHAAHCLSPVAACVWRQCGGERGVAELAVLARVSEGLVADALYEPREKDPYQRLLKRIDCDVLHAHPAYGVSGSGDIEGGRSYRQQADRICLPLRLQHRQAVVDADHAHRSTTGPGADGSEGNRIQLQANPSDDSAHAMLRPSHRRRP
jgi:hypothetical protein